MSIQTIAVYGAGSWGTALALQLARNGLDVLMWDINAAHIADLKAQRENSRYLPGIAFPSTLQVSHELAEVAQFAQHHLLVVPSHGFRPLQQNMHNLLAPNAALIWATKGLEINTGKLLLSAVLSYKSFYYSALMRQSKHLIKQPSKNKGID